MNSLPRTSGIHLLRGAVSVLFVLALGLSLVLLPACQDSAQRDSGAAGGAADRSEAGSAEAAGAGASADERAEKGPQTGRVPAADGVEIFYETVGQGSPAIVFIHGWSLDGTLWWDQAAHLSPTHQVVLFDLPGHGRSGTNRTEWTMEAFGADVEAVVKDLALDKVILVGHSMGGPVMVEAALRMPDRVVGLVGVDNFQAVNAEYPPEVVEGFLKPIREDFQKGVRAWVRSMFHPSADSSLVREIAVTMSSGPPETGLPILESVLDWELHKNKERLAQLHTPLYCINSEMMPTDVEGMRRYVPGFDVILLPDVGHFPMRENPEEFNRALDEVIAKIAGGEESD